MLFGKKRDREPINGIINGYIGGSSDQVTASVTEINQFQKVISNFYNVYPQNPQLPRLLQAVDERLQ